jgi:predicted nucleic acid-binding protein
MEKVYIETSFISFLSSKPSRDLLATAWQQVSLDWWEYRRPLFDLYTSELVLVEAKRGDKSAAERRLSYLEQLPVLNVTDSAIVLAQRFIDEGAMSPKAFGDALHVALAVVHRMDYLLTWNCRHIDNAQTKTLVRRLCASQGLSFPEICTPQELMGEIFDEESDY